MREFLQSDQVFIPHLTPKVGPDENPHNEFGLWKFSGVEDTLIMSQPNEPEGSGLKGVPPVLCIRGKGWQAGYLAREHVQ